ncbi:MAG: FtsW/RodA/SpoVE family cell cycle protein [Phycisphaerales bacterium]|nr:MAG: FtsW/RodA/SpoVE family cell cycle protein [Phycisphaerales bacterium]
MEELKHSNEVHPGSIVLVTLALLTLGLVVVASATASLDRPMFAAPLWQSAFCRQAVFAAIGVAVMIIARYLSVGVLATSDRRARVSHVLFALVLVCLVAALVPSLADPHRGSQRWLQIAPLRAGIGFQPSEFAKLAMVGMLAALLTERKTSLRSFRGGFLPVAGAIGAYCLLVGKEDFGTAVLLGAIGVGMLFVAGCRIRHLFAMGLVGACGFGALLVTAPYRLERLTAYQDIWADPKGAGYQPVQSLATIASGGWWGTGLGGGVQKYGYLPESHSDFIFSVICEEMGMLGGCLVIGLYCAFVWLGLRTMMAARTPFERILAFGITATVGLQAAMNIAVVTVVTPTTGISLPLISAGGSGVVTFCVASGVLAAIAARTRQGSAALVGGLEGSDGAVRHVVPQEATAW